MAQVTELVTKFGFEGDISPLYDFNTELASSITVISGAVAAIAGLTAAFTALAISEIKALDPLVQLSRETGIAASRLQELGFIASVSGSSFDAMTASLIGLEQKIGEASIRGSEDFARLGISVRDANGNIKSADQVLEEVGRRFRSLGLSMAQQRTFAQTLGIDASLIQLLSGATGQLSELQEQVKDFGNISKEQADQIVATNDAITTTTRAFDGLRQQIVLGIGPDLEELTNGFTELILENADWVKAVAEDTIAVTKALIDSLERLTPVLGVIAAGFAAAKVAGMGFAGVMGIIASPIVLWTTAIVAGLAVLDDLIVAFNGGKSVIADFFQEFLGVDIVNVMRQTWEWLKELFVDISDTVGTVMGFLGFSDDNDINVNANGTISAAPGAVPSNVRIEQTNQITIQTTNAEEARIGVEQALQGQLRDAEDIMRRGE